MLGEKEDRRRKGWWKDRRRDLGKTIEWLVDGMMNIGKDDRRIEEYKDRSRKDRKMKLGKHDKRIEGRC